MTSFEARAPLLALVVPCYNEEDILQQTRDRLVACLVEAAQSGIISAESYICFVDDGSTDATWTLIRSFCASSNRVRGIKLSRNFGHQLALLAGLLRVKDNCDCSVSIDADLQQDERVIPEFIDAYRKGADIVSGVRRDRATDGAVKRFTAEAFYRLMSMLGITIIRNHADYRLLSRRALIALAQFHESNIFLRGLVHYIGFNKATVYFDVKDRQAGESKYTFRKMLSFALTGITSFTVAPLRVIAVIGIVFTAVSVVMSGYVLVRRFFFSDVVPGWASTVLPIYLLGGIQLLAIGVIGEYVGRAYLETKSRPRYIVEDDLFG